MASISHKKACVDCFHFLPFFSNIEQEYELRIKQEIEKKNALNKNETVTHSEEQQVTKYKEKEETSEPISFDDDRDKLPKHLRPKRIKNPLDPAVQDELKHQPREDLMNNYYSNRILRRIVEEGNHISSINEML
jgi:hypothetical protein